MKPQNNIQLHTFNSITMQDGSIVITDVDIKELLSDFYYGDVLDSMEFSDIMDYVVQVRREDDNE